MIEISLTIIDIIATLLVVWCVVFNLDWGLSGKNPYGVYCKWRNINDSRIAAAMLLTSLIGSPLGLLWLVMRYGSWIYTACCNAVVFVP